MSARLVAASTMIPLLVPKPSISVRSWLRVFSRSSFEPMFGLRPRARPTASISSMKIMQGAFSLAWRKRSRTREAPTPTNISTKSDPDMEKKGTLASPATALASRVLPVPGGAYQQGSFWNFAAQVGISFRIAEKLNNFFYLLFGLGKSGNIFKRYFG